MVPSSSARAEGVTCVVICCNFVWVLDAELLSSSSIKRLSCWTWHDAEKLLISEIIWGWNLKTYYFYFLHSLLGLFFSRSSFVLVNTKLTKSPKQGCKMTKSIKRLLSSMLRKNVPLLQKRKALKFLAKSVEIYPLILEPKVRAKNCFSYKKYFFNTFLLFFHTNFTYEHQLLKKLLEFTRTTRNRLIVLFISPPWSWVVFGEQF